MNKELFYIDLDKLAKEAKRNQEASRYTEDKRKREAIYKEITKETKFVSTFVNKCQSCQTGEKTVFYDIDIEKMPPVIANMIENPMKIVKSKSENDTILNQIYEIL